MTHTMINAYEIQQLVLQTFGDREIIAATIGNTMVLTAAEKEHIHKNTSVDKLCGMFKNTNLLSSDDFAKNKIMEKELEDKKYSVIYG